jgi:hypothetical protein
MKKHMGPLSVPFVFAGLLVVLAMTVETASAQAPSAPADLRVDISDGTTGQLFVSWNQVSGATYYNLERSTSSTGPFTTVAACSGLSNASILDTPWV